MRSFFDLRFFSRALFCGFAAVFTTGLVGFKVEVTVVPSSVFMYDSRGERAGAEVPLSADCITGRLMGSNFGATADTVALEAVWTQHEKDMNKNTCL